MIAALIWLAACSSPPAPPPPEPVVSEPPAPAPLAIPAGASAEAPHLTSTPDGLLLSWWETDGEFAVLRAAEITAEGVQEPIEVRKLEDALVNWADVPTVWLTPTGWLATWPGHAEGHAYDLMLAKSSDGDVWTDLGPAHGDKTATEHGFPSVASGPDATWLIYLDGRETGSGGPMTLRATKVGEQVEPGEVVDPRVCDCCGTDALMMPSGPVVAYRDRSDEEVRDIGLAAWTEDGWTRTLFQDGWTIKGCPVNGPALDNREEQIAMAWYTEGGGPRVKVLTGTVAEPGKPVDVAEGDHVLGRVDVALTEHGPVVSWLEKHDVQGKIMARRIDDGLEHDAFEVGITTTSRSAGFPVVGRLDDALVWVWTVPGTGLSAVTLPISELAR